MRQLSSEPAEAGFSLPELVRCPACGLMLGRDDFSPDRWKKSGLASKCKGCDRVRSKRYYDSKKAERPPRLCIVCEEVTWTSQSRYCQQHADEALNARIRSRYRRTMTAAQLQRARQREHRRQREARPFQALIYNSDHHRLRKLLKPQVDAGLYDCWRCGEQIHAGELWHLGHVDGDPTRYAGPEHVRCNCATAKRDRRKHRRKLAANDVPGAVVEDCD